MLTRAVLLFGTYGQLNCPCLAGMEVLCQRVAQLIAYAGGDAQRPNFKGVRHFVSEVSSTNVVPVHLRTYAHKKAKEEHDMEALRFKAGAGTPAAAHTRRVAATTMTTTGELHLVAVGPASQNLNPGRLASRNYCLRRRRDDWEGGRRNRVDRRP